MLLSVVVYNHRLTLGQWAGAGVVFAGIAVEAFIKRKGRDVAYIKGQHDTELFCVDRCARETGYTGEGKGKIEGFVTDCGYCTSRLYRWLAPKSKVWK